MKAYRPDSLEELKLLLAKIPENTAFIAGGTDWIIKERHKEKKAECLVYLNCIPELAMVEEQDNGLFIGAACSMTELESNPLLSGAWRVIAEAAASVGSVQIRNRGTIGGNIVNSSPAADLPAPLICLDAEALVLREERIYKIPVGKLIAGSGKKSLGEKEVLLGFYLPGCPSGMVSHYYKLGFRQEVSIARFGVAIAMKISEDVIKEARVAVNSIGPKAVRLLEIECALEGKYLTKQTADEAGYLLRDYIRNTSKREYKAWASLGVMEDALGKFALLT